VRVLLDTCALIWFLRDDPELSELAAELIEDERNEAFVSVASIWEIAIKCSIGKLSRPEGLETSLETQLLECGFSILPIQFSHAVRVASLPLVHRDPFDRLLIAQCLAEDLVALTDDPQWQHQEYAVTVVW